MDRGVGAYCALVWAPLALVASGPAGMETVAGRDREWVSGCAKASGSAVPAPRRSTEPEPEPGRASGGGRERRGGVARVSFFFWRISSVFVFSVRSVYAGFGFLVSLGERGKVRLEP
ncbi:hypothetical protein TraAM80_06342 [Trypanosoma rangeli]|uniref:Uncharacterized protein n=1 Tax=Trypanosoma rangeli TaxID=5698 RepID=A0A422NAL4_TRYRA|nr:uncharacterized protein TraAM80_06342 [Trypanosoma rangeli]RNF02517.1 hypothetical protein TraAM80_06342 [Trypanosoma rangeli]|eukprot:RNF02517.1 hypothetical protein TraAM80_06342 [Trypanosoma rangeli]